ncbi:MAG: ABC transporter substrate-binding protein [Weeksellaceae bacterium]
MKKLIVTTGILMASLMMLNCKSSNAPAENPESEPQTEQQRIVSLNATVSEVLAELGMNGELVGRDATSVYPQWIKDSVQNFGPPWLIGAEALLSVKPDIVFAVGSDLNSDKVNTLKDAGVKVVVFDKTTNLEEAKSIIKQVSAYTKNQDYQPLIDKIDADLAKVEAFTNKPKVLFVYARGTGLMQVAGNGTPMAEVIELAGAENAAAEFDDMKELTPESLVQSNPDVILMFDSGMNSLGGVDGLGSVPGMKETNAFKNRALLTMDSSLLSGMGPRLGEAAYQLNQLLKAYAQ